MLTVWRMRRFPRALAFAQRRVRHGVFRADSGEEEEAVAKKHAAIERRAHGHQLVRCCLRDIENLPRRVVDVFDVELGLAETRSEKRRDRARRRGGLRRNLAQRVDHVPYVVRRARVRARGKARQGVGEEARGGKVVLTTSERREQV